MLWDFLWKPIAWKTQSWWYSSSMAVPGKMPEYGTVFFFFAVWQVCIGCLHRLARACCSKLEQGEERNRNGNQLAYCLHIVSVMRRSWMFVFQTIDDQTSLVFPAGLSLDFPASVLQDAPSQAAYMLHVIINHLYLTALFSGIVKTVGQFWLDAKPTARMNPVPKTL